MNRKIYLHRRGFALIELILAIAVFVLLIPPMYEWLFTHVKSAEALRVSMTADEQLLFAVSHIEQRLESADTVQVEGSYLIVDTPESLYEFGLRSKRIYQKQNAYRYLTLPPVSIDDLEFVQISQGFIRMVVHLNGEESEFLFRVGITQGEP